MHTRQASVHPGPNFRTCFLLAAAPLACIDSVRRAPTAGGRRGQEAKGLAWRVQCARAGTHAPGPAAKHAPPGATLLYTRENQHSRLTVAPNIRHEERQRPRGRRGAQAAQRHSRDEGCRAVGEHVHAPGESSCEWPPEIQPRKSNISRVSEKKIYTFRTPPPPLRTRSVRLLQCEKKIDA